MFYAATIFLSAFLLFQVQPLVGRLILPWFGGTSAVWTTCLLFFQVFLLAGYSYAHLLASRLSPRRQGMLHIGLLGAATVALFAAFPASAAWKPDIGDAEPLGRILLLLAACIGLPYLVIASTGPLLQDWFGRTHPGRSPYRLYALSNAGSLLALLTYPFLFERFTSLFTQTWLWKFGFMAFAGCCGWCAAQVMRLPADAPPLPVAPQGKTKPAPPVPRPDLLQLALWLLLPACGTILLMAVTNQMCQDVAVIPFLWILPLTLYLLTFIICFDNENWYVRPMYVLAFCVSTAAAAYTLLKGVEVRLMVQIVVLALALFTACMTCHGELVRLKPHPSRLTLFYLMISAGGALGGLFVALVAPFLFQTGFWELPVGVMLNIGLLFLAIGRDWWRTSFTGDRRSLKRNLVFYGGAVAAAAGISLSYLLWDVFEQTYNEELGRHGAKDVLASKRNFFGILRVKANQLVLETRDEKGELTKRVEHPKRDLVHGRILHGFQLLDEEKRVWPTSYYGENSGVGIAVNHHPKRYEADRTFRLGVIGLGTGTMAAYGRKGDYLRFYEINPVAVEFSDEYFSFRSDARARGADVDIFLGDARVVMERQLERDGAQRFDVLAVDAFSSDAIPIHLLTAEAFEVYWKHLEPDGLLCLHISNRYLDLAPVCRKLAEISGKQALSFDMRGVDAKGEDSSDWVVVTSNRDFIEDKAVAAEVTAWTPKDRSPVLWTDDFSDLSSILRHGLFSRSPAPEAEPEAEPEPQPASEPKAEGEAKSESPAP